MYKRGIKGSLKGSCTGKGGCNPAAAWNMGIRLGPWGLNGGNQEKIGSAELLKRAKILTLHQCRDVFTIYIHR